MSLVLAKQGPRSGKRKGFSYHVRCYTTPPQIKAREPSLKKAPLDPPLKVAQPLTNTATSQMKKATIHGSSEKDKVNPYTESLKNFQYYYMGMGDQMHEIKLHESIMGSNHTIMIGKINVAQWLRKKIEANHISLYIRYMWDTECHKIDHMYGFLCPTSISPEGCYPLISDRQKYVVNTLKGDTSMKMFFAPYNTGSLKVFWAHREKNKPRQYTRWVKVKGPRQPNLVDCGYYVLRYIREIVAVRNTNSIPEGYYNKRQHPYSSKEIDQIRVEWFKYFIKISNEEVVA